MSAGRQKIVLYNPRAVFFTMPLGLLAVGSALDPTRYEVVIIDGRLESDPETRVVAELEGALCLGVSVLTGAPLGDALEVIRRAKAAFPGMPVICGGWHPSLFAIEMLEEPAIDITVQGQGERTFGEIVDRLSGDRDLSGINGIAYRTAGVPQRNPPNPMIDMEELPPLDYDLIPVERYFALKGQRQMDFISSVGCHFRCAFCADPFVYKRKWNALSPETLDIAVDALWRRYKFTDLNFQDETFFTYRQRIAEIAERFIARGSRFTWAATMRADQGVRLPDKIFENCVRSGLRRVLIGVETGSPEMMKRIQKDTTVEQILEAAEKCRRHGIAVIFSFIVGFPEESWDEVRMTLRLVKRLRAMSPRFETPIFYYKPYPGSALARGIAADTPGTLDGWARFDYVQGAAGPWVTPAAFRYLERFKFYNHHAWGQGSALRAPLRALARLRCQFDAYGLPVEKLVADRLRPRQKLS